MMTSGWDRDDTKVKGSDDTLIGSVNDSLKTTLTDEQDNVVTSKTHHEIHEGKLFSSCDSVTVNKNNNYYIKVTSPNTATRIHFTFGLSISSPGSWAFYENPTTTGGTSFTPKNRDRNSANTATATVRTGVSVTSLGTSLCEEFIFAAGSSLNDFVNKEIILKQNEEYLIEISSLSNGNTVNWFIDWYEE